MARSRTSLELLSDAERVEHERRLRANYGSLSEMERRRLRRARVGCLLGLVVVAISALDFGFMTTGFDPVWVSAAIFFVPFFGIAVGGTVLQVVHGFAQQRYAADYLAEIGYSGRKPEPKREVRYLSADDGPRYPVTGGYDPQRYYSYSREERQFMHDRGMDADLYDSNVRDHDPS